MKFITTGLAICVAVSSATAQELQVPPVTYPKIQATGKLPSDFVPKGWKLEKEFTGDLNKDGKLDAVLLLLDNDPKNIITDPQYREGQPVNTNPRMIAVVFAEPETNSYKFMYENHKLIPRIVDSDGQSNYDDGEMSVERGTLKIGVFNLGGSIVRNSFQFRYQNTKFELIGFESMIVDRSGGTIRRSEINFSTSNVVRATGTISSDVEKIKNAKLKPGSTYAFDYQGDGFDLGAELENR